MAHSNPTHQLPVHFPPKLYAALKEIAEARGVSVTSLVIKACDAWVYGEEYFTESAPYIREYPTMKQESENENG